jgi:hypothetical protein
MITQPKDLEAQASFLFLPLLLGHDGGQGDHRQQS